MTRLPQRFWSLGANPQRYRVLDAVKDLETDLWTTKGKPIQQGDRVAIWKFRGRDRERGVVALGEVMTDPVALSDHDNPYWTVAPSRSELEERVVVRYVSSKRLPLWYCDETRSFLDQLVISRVQGGTVYEITPDQWETLLEGLGGWPEDASGL